jgi:hypothetical protein
VCSVLEALGFGHGPRCLTRPEFLAGECLKRAGADDRQFQISETAEDL